MNHFCEDDRECRAVQDLLPGYLDASLSARSVWDVEKHLATCAGCAAAVREMQSVIALLHDRDRLDTSDDFMAKLHARLDGVEPRPVRMGLRADVVRDLLAGAISAASGRWVPILSTAMAAAAVVLLFAFGPRLVDGPKTLRAPVTEQVSAQALMQNVVAAASNPFDDPVAANLEAETALKDSHLQSNGQEPN